MTRLDDMALFVEVVKARNFRRAAEVLGIPNSTLSRRIAELEKAIGLRLLHRTTRKLEPTEAGLVYFERSSRIVDEARSAHEQLGEMLARPRGTLRASLPVDFATSRLAPLIAEFAELYPEIAFELDLTPRNVDLVSEPYDIAIRMGEPTDPNLIARPLARFTPHLHASPGYLERHGSLGRPEDLARHECLSFPKVETWSLIGEGRAIEAPLGGRFRVNSAGMIRRLATLDLGIALLPAELVADDVGAGRLVRLLPSWEGRAVPVYALTATRLLPAKTQRFIEFLRDRFKSVGAR